jgi:hypothetical protein
MKPYPKVLVYGGRDYADSDFVYKSLAALEERIGAFCVIEGGAKGADTFGGLYADANGMPHATMKAPWDYYKKGAGPIRNQWMRDILQPHFGVEFPGGVGTASMRNLLLENAVLIWQPVIYPIPPAYMIRGSVGL